MGGQGPVVKKGLGRCGAARSQQAAEWPLPAAPIVAAPQPENQESTTGRICWKS